MCAALAVRIAGASPMPRSPIDELLDTVEWDAHPAPEDLEPGTVYATHSGTLDVGGVLLRVHQLPNGQRVIDERSILELLGAVAE